MDQRQKSTLRGHQKVLANDLILDEDFFADLRKNKIFTEGMIATIKNVQPARNQVYKMLEMLEKRGPNAFDNFVWILKENYDWLACTLEDGLQQRDRIHSSTTQVTDRTRMKSSFTRDTAPIRSLNRANSTPMFNSRTSAKKQPIPVQVSDGKEKRRNESYPSDVRFQTTDKDYESETFTESDYDDVDDGGGIARHMAQSPEAPHGGVPTASLMRTRSKISTADACNSPIHTIHIQKKMANAICSPIPLVETSNEAISTTDDENCDKAVDENTEEYSTAENIANEHFEDGMDNDDDGSDMNDSEVFYATLMRANTRGEDGEDTSMLDDVDGGDPFERCGSSLSSASFVIPQNEEYNDIREIYIKLLKATTATTDSDEDAPDQGETDTGIDEMGITFDMIHELIDKLIERLRKAEDATELIVKCYTLFDDKDKKLTLYKCIEKLKDAKADLNNRLLDEMRKTNEMANDMYKFSRDMKNLEKLRTNLARVEKENNDLKGKCALMESEKWELSKKIAEQESTIKMLEESRTAEKSKKRPTLPSPRKPSVPASKPPSMPRMTGMAYQQRSPRNQTTSLWRAGISKK